VRGASSLPLGGPLSLPLLALGLAFLLALFVALLCLVPAPEGKPRVHAEARAHPSEKTHLASPPNRSASYDTVVPARWVPLHQPPLGTG
jgi:hypothetical protein